jgi:hypothetical protein
LDRDPVTTQAWLARQSESEVVHPDKFAFQQSAY